MARWIRSTALSMSRMSMGEVVRERSRSRNSAASSAEEMPRAASTVVSRYGYPAPRRRATSCSFGVPMVHFLNFTGVPSFHLGIESHNNYSIIAEQGCQVKKKCGRKTLKLQRIFGVRQALFD